MERRERSRSRARASLPQPWQDLLSEILDLGESDLTVSVSREQEKATVVLVHRFFFARLCYSGFVCSGTSECMVSAGVAQGRGVVG